MVSRLPKSFEVVLAMDWFDESHLCTLCGGEVYQQVNHSIVLALHRMYVEAFLKSQSHFKSLSDSKKTVKTNWMTRSNQYNRMTHVKRKPQTERNKQKLVWIGPEHGESKLHSRCPIRLRSQTWIIEGLVPKSQVSRHLTPVTGLSDVDVSMCWIRDRPGVTKERAIASQASVDTDFGPVVARFSDQNVSCVTLCSEPKANFFGWNHDRIPQKAWKCNQNWTLSSLSWGHPLIHFAGRSNKNPVSAWAQLRSQALELHSNPRSTAKSFHDMFMTFQCAYSTKRILF